MEVISILAAFAFAVNKTVSVIKSLVNGTLNTPLTQLLVWTVSVLGLWLLGQADVTESIIIPGFDRAVGKFDVASLVLVGWILGGTGSFLYDFKKAFDNGDDADEPRLLHEEPAQE